MDYCYAYLQMIQIKTFMSFELQFFLIFLAFFILEIKDRLLFDSFDGLFDDVIWIYLNEFIGLFLKMFQEFLADLGVFSQV